MKSLSIYIKVQTMCSAKNSEEGFSLIHVALGVMVLGIIGTGLLQTYTVHVAGMAYKDTAGSLAKIETAINQFFIDGNNRYPCPTSLNATEGDADFGEEGNCTLANFNAIPLCSATWKTTTGYCRTTNASGAVIVGGVPFDALKLNFEDAVDYWKNKIFYAVTYQKTVTANFESSSGTVQIMTMDDSRDAGADQVPDLKAYTDQPDFFLYSAGSNGRGAFTISGTEFLPCAAMTQGYENENCDFDSTFFADTDSDVQRTGALNYNAGTFYYDDITRYQLKVPSQMWFPNRLDADHIQTMAQRVGIGTNDPQETVHVVGNIKAPDQVRSDSFCDNSTTNCFDPELITGSMAQMSCDSPGYDERGVLRLAQNRVFCNSGINSVNGSTLGGDAYRFDPSILQPRDCGATGQLVVGIDATGMPICGNI